MSNRLALGLLAVACISAAAGGGYLATRQNAIPVPTAAQTAPVSAPSSTVPSATAPSVPPAVQETEAILERGSQGSQGSRGSQDRGSQERGSKGLSSQSSKPQSVKSSHPVAQNAQAAPGTLSSSWPSGAAQQPAPVPAPPASAIPDAAAPRTDDHPVQEPPHQPEPPRPTFDELVISRDSVIGLQTENRISSDTAHVEDRVEARLTRDVRVGDHIAIPSGAHVIGTVTQVERGGKYKEQAKLGIRFHTIVLADGTRLAISTEPIIRMGEAPGNKTAQKIGGATVGGAILGAILGGAKGAAIGATAGAGAGTAVVQAGDGSTVVLQPGTPLTARILSPVTVTVQRN